MTGVVEAAGRFVWDFVVGDDWRLPVAVAAVLGLGALLARLEVLRDGPLAVLVAGLLVSLVSALIVGPAARTRSRLRAPR